MATRLVHIVSLIAVTLIAIFTKPFWNGTTTELIIAGVFILIAGVPHGSLDHLVAKQRQQNKSLLIYMFGYLASAALFLLLWLWLPGLAFIFFILLTAWHFGETDFVAFYFKNTNAFIIFIYGACLTFWLLWQNTTILEQWTAVMTSKSAIASKFVTAIATIPNLVWMFVVALITLLNTNKFKIGLIEKALFLLFIYLISHTSLLIGFTLYFTGWHSLNALSHLRHLVFSRTSIAAMLKHAIPITLAAVGFLFVVAWLSNGAWLNEHALPSLLVLLSILTLPHMTEMHKLYTKQSSK
jgi:beta-carotene 15,15'-dioxygenase